MLRREAVFKGFRIQVLEIVRVLEETLFPLQKVRSLGKNQKIRWMMKGVLSLGLKFAIFRVL